MKLVALAALTSIVAYSLRVLTDSDTVTSVVAAIALVATAGIIVTVMAIITSSR